MSGIAINNTAMRTVSVELPATEYNFFKTLSRKMGWVTKTVSPKRQAKCELDKALENLGQGEMKSFDNVDELMDYLNS